MATTLGKLDEGAVCLAHLGTLAVLNHEQASWSANRGVPLQTKIFCELCLAGLLVASIVEAVFRAALALVLTIPFALIDAMCCPEDQTRYWFIFWATAVVSLLNAGVTAVALKENLTEPTLPKYDEILPCVNKVWAVLFAFLQSRSLELPRET